jgi:hypothetical protein
MRKGNSLAHYSSRYHEHRDGGNRQPRRRGLCAGKARGPASRGQRQRSPRLALRARALECGHQDGHAPHGRAGERAVGAPGAPVRPERLHPGRHHPEREWCPAIGEQQLRVLQHLHHPRTRLAVLPRRSPRRLPGQRLSPDADRRVAGGHPQGSGLSPLRQRRARGHHQHRVQAAHSHAALQRIRGGRELRDVSVRDRHGWPARRDPGLSAQHRPLPHGRLP